MSVCLYVHGYTKQLSNSDENFCMSVCIYIEFIYIVQVQHWLLQFATELAERLSEDIRTVS